MIYTTIEEISISEFNEKAPGLEGTELSHMLLGLAASDDDWKTIQSILIDYLSHPNVSTISTAMLALSHLARLSNRLDKDMVIEKLLETVEKHPSLAGRLEDVLDDLSVIPLHTD